MNLRGHQKSKSDLQQFQHVALLIFGSLLPSIVADNFAFSQEPSITEFRSSIEREFSDHFSEVELNKAMLQLENSTEHHLDFLDLLIQPHPTLSVLLEEIRRDPILDHGPNLKKLENPWVRNHLQLEWARRLIRAAEFQQAVQILESCSEEFLLSDLERQVSISICEHQLVQFKPAKQRLNFLKQNREKLSARNRSMVRTLLADIQKSEQDPTYRISSLMRDLSRRQKKMDHDDAIVKRETEIMQELDELIAQMTKNQGQAAGKGTNGKGNSNGPATLPDEGTPTDSPASRTGLANEKLLDSDPWTDLPAEEKQILIDSLVAEMPTHFKTLVQAYFLRLAKEGDR